MKTKNISKILIAFSFVLFLSCSKTEENTPIINISNLILSSDSSDNLLAVDETINFIVTGDDGVVYTDEATFYVDLVAISGATYTFSSEGSHDVYASFGGVNSNTMTFNVVNASENTLTVDNDKLLKGQSVNFALIDTQGNDVSSTATFYVNDSAITGTVFSSNSEGIFEVYAEYEVAGDILTTSSQTFEVFVPKRKVVIEDYTGAWCGWCPRAMVALEDAENATHDIAVVAIHETSFTFQDPMHFEDIQILKSTFGINGNPYVKLNRTTTWTDVEYPINDVTDIAGEDTNIAISLNSQVSGTNLTVEVKVISENSIDSGAKLVLYLVEDGILYDQVNYYNTVQGHPFEGLGNPIPNYVHNDALRKAISSTLGDNISATPALTEYTRTYSVEISSDYVVNNLELVAMVVNSDNSARNAQTANVGEYKAYE